MSHTVRTTAKTALAVLVAVLAAAGLLLHADVPQVPSNFWTPAGDMTGVRAGASATLLPDGLVLVAGGIDANGETASVERFSPDGAHFLSGQPMQAPRANHTATLLADGRVLVAGGTGAGGTTEATAEIYDPSGPAWLPAGSLNVARRGHTATRLPDGKVLIAGGDNNNVAIDSLEVFDPATALFTIVDGASIGARTLHAAAALLDGRVLIAGGLAGTNPLASTSIYDPETNTVSTGPDLSTPRSGLSATTLLDGRVLVVGGAGAGGELASAEIFDPATNAFTATDNTLSSARQNHLAFLLPHNNQVLIVGGLADNNPVAAAEYFTPWEGTNGTFCAQAICASGYQGPAVPATARAWATGSALSYPADKTVRTGPNDGLLVLAGGNGQQSSELFGFATVTTDKEDYAPGATVKIKGSGWKPHEFVALVLREAPFFDEHPLLDVEADDYGNIISEEFVPDAHDIGIRFYVTAYGEESQAQTTFEDNRNLALLKVAGAGTVTSTVGSLGNSINCNAACTSQTEAFGDTDSVTLTAAPASGFAFTGWVFSSTGGNGPPATPSIGCSTAGTTCTFGMNGNKQEVTATFAAAASVSVTVAPSSVAEDGVSNLSYTFTRTGSTTNPLTINFSTGGTATSGTDYTQSATGTVTFAASSATATVTVDPTTDSGVEADETVVLTVTSGTGYVVGSPSAATGTITNDDTDVTVAVSSSSVPEDGAPNLAYTFTRTGVTTGALTASFSVGGSATFSTDYTQSGAATYTPPTGTVTFGAGNATATVTVDPSADSTAEPDETVILTVTAGTGYNVGSPAAATGTIINDDTEVSVAVAPSSVLEDGATNLVYTFTRTGVTTGALTANFSIGGTATFSTDYTQSGAGAYTPPTGTVTFGAGNATATVTVDPSTDSAVEPDETVILTVTSGTGYTVGSPSAATGTITNDDTDVSVAVAPSSVDEDGATNLVFTFTRSGVTTGALTANFSIGGTAAFSTDYTQAGAATYTPPTGTVTFGAGNATATVTVDPSADSSVEPDETVVLTVTAGTGYNVGAPAGATGTIANDDTDVSVAVAPALVDEDGATNLIFTFTRSGVTTGALTANFSIGGSAAFSTDYTQAGAATYTPPTGTVTFGAGNATATVTVDPSADSTVESDETVVLTVTAGTGYTVGSPAAATGTIANDDTDVSVAVSPASVDEDGATNLVFTFTRSGVTTGALTANFSIGGTAAFSTDYTQAGAATYTPPTGTVTFGAGNATATVTVDPSADSTVESDETVVLTVTAGTGYNVGAPAAATGTIANDDTDVSVAVAPASVDEDGATNLVFTFTRVGVTTGALTANFSIGGTAAFSTDYTESGAASFTPPTGTVTFGAGNATATVTVDPSADSTVESDETVVLTVTAGTGYNVGAPAAATGTIANDDTDVSVAVAPASVDEDGATNLVFTFTRVGVTTGALTANFSIGGTAAFSTDYTESGAASFTPPTGTVTFGAGNATATVTVDPSADSSVEPDETVVLTVTAGVGYNVGSPAAATGTITNDDTDVTVAVSPSSVTEDGAGNLVFTFSRIGVTATPLTVNFSVGGTATFSTDYTQLGAATFSSSSGTVIFGAGSSTTTVTADPTVDSTYETNETVVLTLTAGAGYNVSSPSSATGTINNDDAPPSLSITDVTMAEGNSGITNFVFTVNKTGLTELNATVNFATANGVVNPATGGAVCGAGTDYKTKSDSLSFAPTDSSKTITIEVCGELVIEPAETFVVNLSSPVGATISDSQGLGTISNDDFYGFTGFFAPVDNLPYLNSAQAGQAIPIKWRLIGTDGVPVSDPSSFGNPPTPGLTSFGYACDTLALDTPVEEYAPGESGLIYQGNGYWQINWKTLKTYKNSCRTVVITLSDGTTHMANFKFK